MFQIYYPGPNYLWLQPLHKLVRGARLFVVGGRFLFGLFRELGDNNISRPPPSPHPTSLSFSPSNPSDPPHRDPPTFLLSFSLSRRSPASRRHYIFLFSLHYPASPSFDTSHPASSAPLACPSLPSEATANANINIEPRGPSALVIINS